MLVLFLASYKGFVSLNLSVERPIERRRLSRVAELQRLRELDLGESSLDDDAIEHLKSLPALEVFNGVCDEMTPQAIERFAELRHIRRLTITINEQAWDAGCRRDYETPEPR